MKANAVKKAAAAAALAICVSLGSTVAPAGAVDDHAPHGGATSHPHYIRTGNGDCRTLDGPNFEAGQRGRHRGAGQSGPNHGLRHGRC